MGSNPYFFQFVKQRKRNLSKVSYIEHVLSSSSSLNQKEVLVYLDGGKNWKEQAKKSLENIIHHFLESPLNMTLCHFAHHNPLNLCTEPILWVPFTPLGHPTQVTASIAQFWSMSCFAIVPQCSREVSTSRFSHPKYLASELVSFHVHLIYQLHLYIRFMSLMGDTSRPSLNESIPIEFNTLSRNQT